MKSILRMKNPAMPIWFRNGRQTAVPLVILLLCASIGASESRTAIVAQEGPPLQEQLRARYPLNDTSTAGGCRVRNPERALVVMQPGLATFEESSFPRACSIHFKDGRIKAPGFRCRYTGTFGASTFSKGDLVFPLELKVEKDEIAMTIGYCSPRATLSYSYKTALVFEFPGGFLGNANAQQVEDKIAELLSKDLTKATAPVANAQKQTPDKEAPRPLPAEPKTVEAGMNPEQVVAIMGQPETIAKGPNGKLIYVYTIRKLKIVFVNDKMADIE